MTKKGFLSAEEYKNIRRLLGFSLEEARDFHGVESINTIKRWESGATAVSEKASLKITALLEKINWTISEALKLAEEHPEASETVLIIYSEQNYAKFCHGIGSLPWSIHFAMINRTAALLKEKGVEVRVVEFNPQDYFSFLGAKGLADTQDARSYWAADYINRVKMN